MARFNANTYRPQDDSTPGVKLVKGIDPNTTVILARTADDRCNCGCDQVASKGRQFKQGHDARLKGILIRAHLTGTPVAQVTLRENGSGYVAKSTQSAMQVAQSFKWTKQLKVSEQAFKNRTARKARKAEAPTAKTTEARTDAKGDKVHRFGEGKAKMGDKVTIKVGRWDKVATVVGIHADGVELEYDTAKGKARKMVGAAA
jgi:hypothetical protein